MKFWTRAQGCARDRTRGIGKVHRHAQVAEQKGRTIAGVRGGALLRAPPLGIFIEDLARPENALPPKLRADIVISVGLWVMRETEEIRSDGQRISGSDRRLAHNLGGTYMSGQTVKITLREGERIFLGQAVFRADRRTVLEILNNAPICASTRSSRSKRRPRR